VCVCIDRVGEVWEMWSTCSFSPELVLFEVCVMFTLLTLPGWSVVVNGILRGAAQGMRLVDVHGSRGISAEHGV
jgi:hypothetical protein